jgi:excinuclease ABC subunit A
VARGIDELPKRTRYLIAFPLDVRPDSDRSALVDALREDGFTRWRIDGKIASLESGPLPVGESTTIDVVVDRLVRGAESPERRLDSIETAFAKGFGRCRVVTDDLSLTFYQGWRCGNCGRDCLEPSPRLFRYSSPLGACTTCGGLGRVVDIDIDRVVPDPAKSLRDDALAPWANAAYRGRFLAFLEAAPKLGIPIGVPFAALGAEQVRTVIEGSREQGFAGLRGFFREMESKAHKSRVGRYLNRWRGYAPCPECKEARLRPDALAVKLGGLDLAELSARKVSDVRAFLDSLADTRPEARRILARIRTRLDYIERIGLDYLTLDRPAATLSTGEAQRIALTTALGSGLVSTLYVLDEPSVGLHPHDVGRLIAIVNDLRDAGNTVVVVEHDEELIRAADLVVDLGPGAGEAGGGLLFVGPPDEIGKVEGSPTADFLTGRRKVALPDRRRVPRGEPLRLVGASGHNLKRVDVEFPFRVFCVVTGVSGSGKSTLVAQTLYPALCRALGQEAPPSKPHDGLVGTSGIDAVVLVDQSPIGRSGRSNPVTYLAAFDEIRKTFAATHEAKLRNYGANRFSFNVDGGRCNACEGNGFRTIEMQFLPDVLIRCPECRGKRYRPETLEITYRGLDIAEVLDLTAREAFGFFRHRPKVLARLRPLLDVGLEYLRLGQPAPTLSGGEAQRLKLASELSSTPGAITRAAGKSHTLFILEEPTRGLHPADTLKLLEALNSLLNLGHSVIVIEHSPDVMAAADWIIDLGPGAGDAGGRVVALGTPEEVARIDTPTGRVLAKSLSRA